jgi:ketosteroid isomerase-like protein
MSQENVEIVRRAIETFAREGMDGSFEGLIADDLELRPAFEVTGGTTFARRDGVARFIGSWNDAFDDWAFELDELLDAGEAVAARMRQVGRGRTSGAPVALQFGMVFRLRDGQIARMEIYVTAGEALKAVGVEE